MDKEIHQHNQKYVDTIVTTIYLHGILDNSVAYDLARAFLRTTETEVMAYRIDLTCISDITAPGIALIMMFISRAKRSGVPVFITSSHKAKASQVTGQRDLLLLLLRYINRPTTIH